MDEQEYLVPIIRDLSRHLDAEAPAYRKNTHVELYRLVIEMLGGFQPNDLQGNADKARRANEYIAVARGRTPKYGER